MLAAATPAQSAWPGMPATAADLLHGAPKRAQTLHPADMRGEYGRVRPASPIFKQGDPISHYRPSGQHSSDLASPAIDLIPLRYVQSA